MAIDEIMKLIEERGDKLSQADLRQITMLKVDVPLEQTEDLAWIDEAIALIVNDPLYEGDIPPFE